MFENMELKHFKKTPLILIIKVKFEYYVKVVDAFVGESVFNNEFLEKFFYVG